MSLRDKRRSCAAALLVAAMPVLAALPAQAAGPAGSEIQAALPVAESIRRDRNSARMMVLFRYRRMQTGYVTNKDSPQAYYYRATRAELEFDCRRHRSRVLRTVFFSDPSGLGRVVHEQAGKGAWTHDDGYAQKQSLLFIACKRVSNAR